MFDGVDPAVMPYFVGAEAWPSFAPRVRAHIERMAAATDGLYLADDIVEAISQGRMQVWAVLDGADIACVLLTEVIQYPRARAMRCIGVVGHRPLRWMKLLAAVEHSAGLNFGCTKFQALVSPGHERLLRTGGWKLSHTLYEKSIA